MRILITENPGFNSYITSLIEEYKNRRCEVICGVDNFFFSNINVDMLHVHWPERLFKWYALSKKDRKEQFNFIKERFEYFKSVGTKIVLTVHNLLPHEYANDDFEFYNLVFEYADVLVHHCAKSIKLTEDKFPSIKAKRNIISRHGDYLIDYKKVDEGDAQNQLSLSENKFIILNFGKQSRYKNLRFVEKVFSKLKINNKILVNAGGFSSYFQNRILNKFTSQILYISSLLSFGKKKYFTKSIPPSQIPIFLNSCNVVFLGHRDGLNSGIINLAATFKKPVIYPDIGCFKSQAENWIGKSYKVNNLSSAKQALEEIYNQYSNNEIDYDNSKWLKQNSWENHVENILNAL